MTPDAPLPVLPLPGRPLSPVGLYLHVPFCVSLCPYCDFPVVTGRATRGPASRIPAFVAALHAELDLRADAFDALQGRRCGAPDPAAAGDRLPGGWHAVPPGSRTRSGSSWSMWSAASASRRRARSPSRRTRGPSERGDLAGYRAAGITRLSLGAQSLQPAELRALGRRHRPGTSRHRCAEARAAGVARVSLDLLTDVPGQTVVAGAPPWMRPSALAPDHVSAYALTLEDPDADGLTGAGGDHLPVRPGARRWRERARRAQDQDAAADMDALTDAMLGAAGIARYELSNHARPGHASRHNRGYWLRRPIAAVGPGAHAFDGAAARAWNAARLDGWLAALLPADGPPTAATRRRHPARPRGRRERGGRSWACAWPRASTVPRPPILARPGPGVGRDAWLAGHRRRGRVRLTPRGRLLSNEVFQRLLP